MSLGSESTESSEIIVRLPEGWVVPETIYQSYRDPRDLAKLGLHSYEKKIMKPRNSLDSNTSGMLPFP